MDFIIFCLVAVIVKINLSSVIEKTVMLKEEKKERKCTDLFDILGVSSREMTHWKGYVEREETNGVSREAHNFLEGLAPQRIKNTNLLRKK